MFNTHLAGARDNLHRRVLGTRSQASKGQDVFPDRLRLLTVQKEEVILFGLPWGPEG